MIVWGTPLSSRMNASLHQEQLPLSTQFQRNGTFEKIFKIQKLDPLYTFFLWDSFVDFSEIPVYVTRLKKRSKKQFGQPNSLIIAKTSPF